MTDFSSRQRRQTRRSPNRLRLTVRRTLRRTRHSISRIRESLRRQRADVGIEKPDRWWPRASILVAVAASCLGAAGLVVWLVMAVTALVNHGQDIFGLDLDRTCRTTGVSCGALTGFVVPWLSVGLAASIFLLRRLRTVPGPRRKAALKRPHSLVPTAGSIVGQVVGRDELCKVLIDNVHMSDDRRPQLIVGGVGTGKTAVIVQLTQLLARLRATPVAVRLHDADAKLNFRELAWKQFTDEINARAQSGAEADKIWRHLCRDQRIVVLADGLEEALIDNPDRDDKIRIAIAQARKDKLPLIIASRPHEALRGMDASILELEPISEEAALNYLGGADQHADSRRLDWIVETAGVAEAPLYLRIAHDLAEERLLHHLVSDDTSMSTLNTRSLDRSALRRNLLDTWTSGLIGGRLRGDLPLTVNQRKATVAFIAAFACVGLLRDQLEVKYDEALEASETAPDPSQKRAFRSEPTEPGSRAPAPPQPRAEPHPMAAGPATGSPAARPPASSSSWTMPAGTMLADDVAAPAPRAVTSSPPDDRAGAGAAPLRPFRIMPLRAWTTENAVDRGELGGDVDARLAAIWGDQLGLVGVRGEAVRFQHSVLQAYFGSLAIEGVLSDEEWMDYAFQAPKRPGRELLISLVLLSRAGPSDAARCADLVELLTGRAAGRFDSKSLDIRAAAMEIDASIPAHHDQPRGLDRIVAAAARDWPSFRGSDLRTLEEAKLGFVYRCGEAIRQVDQAVRLAKPDAPDHPDRRAVDEAYRWLFEIGCAEVVSYPVRHAIIQELGAGGRSAFRALEGRFREALDGVLSDDWPGSDHNWKAALISASLAALLYEQVTAPGGQEDGSDAKGRGEFTSEKNLMAWIHRVGRPGLRSGRRSGDHDGPADADAVLGDASDDGRRRPRAADPHAPPAALPISVEVALAQGFKYAANRREQHPRALSDSRTRLSEEAVELLQRSGFWLSQLTLVQALGLWALPDASDGSGTRIPGPSTRGVHRADVRGRVRHWVEIAGELRDQEREPRDQGGAPPTHRFVVEAGELVIRALQTGRPERFIWIDEHGITSKIGASVINRGELRKHALWIPPSIGWSALDGRAQQLVADVLLLINLADRGDSPARREGRLRRANRRDLPLCLTRYRSPLDPNRKILSAAGSEPGKNCPGDCEFDLCPYPPKGSVHYHTEISETFCRRQQTLLGFGVSRKTAPWQEPTRRDLRKFWGEMAKRARR